MRYTSILFIFLIILSGCTVCETCTITNFEECIAAGNPILESHPRQCMDKTQNKTFVEEIPKDYLEQAKKTYEQTINKLLN